MSFFVTSYWVRHVWMNLVTKPNRDWPNGDASNNYLTYIGWKPLCRWQFTRLSLPPRCVCAHKSIPLCPCLVDPGQRSKGELYMPLVCSCRPVTRRVVYPNRDWWFVRSVWNPDVARVGLGYLFSYHQKQPPKLKKIKEVGEETRNKKKARSRYRRTKSN